MNELAQPTDSVALQELRAIQNNFSRLLAVIGDKATCKGCGAEIYWVVNPKTSKRMPITANGLNHFADCPAAAQFRKDKTRP